MSVLYSLFGPVLRYFDAETAHGIAIKALRWGLVPGGASPNETTLGTELWGRRFPNPVGLAAGFDKSAEVPDAMLAQGFGFVEVGSVTPRPQAGNPTPRLFRLTKDRAAINRMGFNNDGMDIVGERLLARLERGGIVGVNLGKNKETEDALSDYVEGARTLAPLADYLVVNVSSPNTPGLRALQGRDELSRLLSGVRDAMQRLDAPPPLLLKVAPDLTDDDKRDIAAVSLDEGIDGLIATNTTIERPPELTDPGREESGGLSGEPLFSPSTAVLADLYSLTHGQIPLIGVGGVASGADAYAKIRAGASLVQFYTAMVFKGPGLVRDINWELAALLARDGFDTVAQAVGADHR